MFTQKMRTAMVRGQIETKNSLNDDGSPSLGESVFRKSIMSRLANKTGAILATIAMAFTIGFMGVNVSQANADPGDVPQANKTRVANKAPNGDDNGTYKLALDIMGDASTEKDTEGRVNVLLVYDTSSSMINRRVMSPTGRYGFEEVGSWSINQYFTLYRSDGPGRYVQLTNDEYAGDVYRLRNGNYEPYEGERYSVLRADAGEKAVYDFVHALFGYQSTTDPTNIQVAAVGFSANSSQIHGWTSTESDLLGNSSGHFHNTGTNHGLNYPSGTNYEAGLKRALTLLGTADEDTTFVVFITDGQPSRSDTSGNSSTNPYGDTHGGRVPLFWHATDEARQIENYNTETHQEDADNSNTTFFGIYAFGEEDDFLDDLVHFARNGNVDGRPMHTYEGADGTIPTNAGVPEPVNPNVDYGTDPTEGYYNASNSTELAAAISDIFGQIVRTLGIAEVSITDGTTSNVETTTGVSHLLEVDDTTFEYWLTFPVSGGKITRVDTLSGVTYETTVTDNDDGTCTLTWVDNWTNPASPVTKTVVAKGELGVDTFKYKWETLTDFYLYAPPPATFNGDTGEVNWNLSSVKALLDDVKYTVTFDAYPSQYTYDTIAALKNGDIAYGSLDENVRNYLHDNGDGSYSLETNTTASFTYDDTRTDADERLTPHYYSNPPAVPTEASQLIIKKEWENGYDPKIRMATDMDMYLYRDGVPVTKIVDGEEVYVTIPLTQANNWTNSEYIAIGLLTTSLEDGKTKIKVRDPGHDYELVEPENVSYYWDLDAEISHPMLVDGTPMTMVKAEGAEQTAAQETMDASGNDVVTIGGVTYYNLGAALGIYKATDSQAMVSAMNYRRSYLNLTKVTEPESYEVAEGTTFPFTFTVDDPSITTPTEKGDDIWFSIQDADGNTVNDARIEGAEKEIGYRTVDPNDSRVTDFSYDPEAGTISYSWDGGPVTTYSGAVDNGDGTYSYSTGFTGYYYFRDGGEVTVYMEPTWNLRVINLLSGTTYSFTEVEDEMPDGYAFESAKVEWTYEGADSDFESGTAEGDKTTSGTIEHGNTNYTVTYSNTMTKVDVTVTKKWDDADNNDGLRPDSVQATLSGKVTIVDPDTGESSTQDYTLPDTVEATQTLNAANSWTYTWTDLATIDDAGNVITYAVDEEKTEVITGEDGDGTYSYTVTKDTEPRPVLDENGDPVLDENGDPVMETPINAFLITNKHTPVPVAVSATKAWKNFDGSTTAPVGASVTFTLYEDGVATDQTVTLDGEADAKPTGDAAAAYESEAWTASFINLPKYADGQEIVYTIGETAGFTGYTADPTDPVANGGTITNKQNPISVDVKKEWNDHEDEDKVRPTTITITLTGTAGDATFGPYEIDLDGVVDGTPTVTTPTGYESAAWTATFINLPEYAYTASGATRIVYTATETGVAGPDDINYSAKTEVDDDGTITITNTHPAETDVSATKAWKNADGSVTPPAEATVTFELYKNGTATGSTITLDGTIDETGETAPWVATFVNLQKYDDADQLIEYTVKEVGITNAPGYTASPADPVAAGETITNTQPETTATATKAWKNADGSLVAPANGKVTFTLFANGEATEYTVELDGKTEGETAPSVTGGYESAAWVASFVHLPQFDGEGNEITYTITESTTFPGYTASTTDPVASGSTITNSQEETALDVKKDWHDHDNADQVRPASITIVLNANGEATEHTVVLDGNAEGEVAPSVTGGFESEPWVASFVHLPKLDAEGEAITYTATETGVAGPDDTNYSAEIVMNDDGTITIINTHPAITTAQATKEWRDVNGNIIDAPEGATVTFTLYKKTSTDTDAQPTALTVTLDGEADAEPTGDAEAAYESEAWVATFVNLQKYDDANQLITYSIKETSGYADYTASTTDPVASGGTIANTRGSGDLTIEKKVEPGTLTPPAGTTFTVSGPADFTTTTVTYDRFTEGKYTFTNVPTGEYTVIESNAEIAGYTLTTTYSNNGKGTVTTSASPATITVTNTYASNDVTITKAFDGAGLNDAQKAKVLGAMTVELTPTEGEPLTATYDAESQAFVFKAVPNGTYAVTETGAELPGYSFTMSPDPASVTVNDAPVQLAITNTYEPMLISIPVNKTWVDDDNAYGTRPSSITLNLDASEASLSTSVTVTPAEDGSWSYTFTDLPKYYYGDGAEAREVTYQVSEAAVDNYVTTVTANEDGSYAITNTLNIGTVQLEATKALVGRAWLANESYTFTLTGAEGAPMPAQGGDIATFTANETQQFGTITYSKPGTYNYTISETSELPAGISKSDDIAVTVEVVVDESDPTKLVATATYSRADKTITNTYAATGSAQLEAVKVLEGRDWMDGESYVFRLIGSDGAVIEAIDVTKDNASSLQFVPIGYTQADLANADGTYAASKDFTYTISEIGTNADGSSALPANVTKSADITATVTVTDNGDGTLSTSVAYTPENKTITNTYAPDPTQAQIKVTKAISGYIPGSDNTFNFTLAALDGAPMPDGDGNTASITTSNGAGEALFGEIKYTEVGTYKYTVTETKGDAAGFSYDETVYNVTVTVTDDPEHGKLVAEVAYAAEGATAVDITNPFKEQSVKVTLTVNKIIKDESNSAEDGTFTFELRDAAGAVLQTKTIATEDFTGTVDFDELVFEASGTYNYIIQETGTASSGWTYDTKEYPVVITVSDNFETAILESATTIDGETTTEVDITNVYKAKETKLTLEVTKNVEDTSGSAPDVTFNFELTSEGAPMPGDGIDQVSIVGSGTAQFGEIVYEKAGSFDYIIHETGAAGDGWTYDVSDHHVTVTITDNGGALEANAVYDPNEEGVGGTSLTITNKYEPKPATAQFQIRKLIEEKTKAPDETFTFQLLDADKNVIEEVSRENGGLVDFTTTPTFTKVGTYTYYVQEVPGTAGGWTYDETLYKVTVEVTDVDAKLVAKVVYEGADEDGELVITNPYEAKPVSYNPPVRKYLEVPADAVTPANAQFTFTIAATNPSDAPLPASTEITLAPKDNQYVWVEFGEMTFTEAGTYEYTVTESGTVEGVTNDANATRTLKIVVVDENGELVLTEVTYTDVDPITFVNTVIPQEKPPIPQTGDDLAKVVTPLGILTAVSGLLALGLGIARRQRKQ